MVQQQQKIFDNDKHFNFCQKIILCKRLKGVEIINFGSKSFFSFLPLSVTGTKPEFRNKNIKFGDLPRQTRK